MNFNIIGAGRLGIALSSALITYTHWQLTAVLNRRVSSAQRVCEVLGQGYPVEHVLELPHADVTFITVPDDDIASVAEALSQNAFLKPGDIVVHCSGVHASTILQRLKTKGCLLASVHPFKAFRSAIPPSHPFKDCDCMVEGDAAVVALLITIFGQMSAKVISLSASKKALYHAAATMASNYLVTLASCATAMLIEAGIEPSQAKSMCERLMDSNVQNIRASAELKDALTGPLMRGDLNTISQHLNAIHTPHIEGLYRAAGLATLPLTNHSDDVLIILKSLFNHQ